MLVKLNLGGTYCSIETVRAIQLLIDISPGLLQRFNAKNTFSSIRLSSDLAGESR